MSLLIDEVAVKTTFSGDLSIEFRVVFLDTSPTSKVVLFLHNLALEGKPLTSDQMIVLAQLMYEDEYGQTLSVPMYSSDAVLQGGHDGKVSGP